MVARRGDGVPEHVAVALAFPAVRKAYFNEPWIEDARLRALARKVAIVESPAATAAS